MGTNLITSPIEMKMYEALKLFKQQKPTAIGVFVQHKIPPYIADFLVTVIMTRKYGSLKLLKVIVECDGHEFHEKTKEQAAKDKKRDRHMQKLGFSVLRFSGSEIYRDVMSCVYEIGEQLDQLAKD